MDRREQPCAVSRAWLKPEDERLKTGLAKRAGGEVEPGLETASRIRGLAYATKSGICAEISAGRARSQCRRSTICMKIVPRKLPFGAGQETANEGPRHPPSAILACELA